jgi:hypothetical protein
MDGILDLHTDVHERKNESHLQNGTGHLRQWDSLAQTDTSKQRIFPNKPHTVDLYTSVVFSPVHHYTSVDGYTLVVGSLCGTLHTTFTVE